MRLDAKVPPVRTTVTIEVDTEALLKEEAARTRQSFKALLLWPVLLLSVASPALGASTNSAPWFSGALVGMEVGPTGAQFAGGQHAPGYAANFNGREIVRRCAEANAEYLVLWVRDGEFTFHDSKLLPRPPGQRDRDVLREAVEEGHKLDLPIIVYCQLQYPAYELRQHPEWKARQANGEPIHHLVCYNTPYTNVVKTLLAEMLDYGIAGFHLDMVDQGFGPPHGCWCDHCQTLFQAEYGRPLPKGVNWEDEDWDRMLQFRYATSDRLEKMGTVLTFAGSPDFATASEHHIVEARKLFANAVRLLHPNPRVRVTAPANIEAVVTDDPATRTLRVHLIAYNATPQTTPAKDRPYVLPGLIEEVPMFRATLELPGGLKSAKALNRTTQLKRRGQRVELVIEDIHEVIQCRY
jgi:hypothetical protein